MTDRPAPASDALAHRLQLADWRRRIADLYAQVRTTAATDPIEAWELWRSERETLYRLHPQSPVPAAERSAFRARHWPYDPAMRFHVAVGPAPAPVPGAILSLPNSGADVLEFDRVGIIALPFADGTRRLAVYWMRGYAGGLFVPFRDATSGTTTYGAGRYALDTAKGADLGGDAAAGTLVVDLNFAFHPSCAFDPRWACPLAPPENTLDLPVEAGERLR